MKKDNQFHKDEIFAIFDNFADGLLVFNESKELSLINTAAEKIFELEKKDILGKTIEEFHSIEPANNLFYLLGKDIKEVFRKELEITEDLILEVTSSKVKNIANLVILHDVTREKRVEKMKNEFVTISAHQLRTPLSAIQWSLEILLKKDLTEEQKSLVERAFKDNKRMVSLVNDLLNLVKIEEGKDIYNLVPRHIENTVHNVIKYYKEKIKKKEIKFQFQVLDRLPKVKVDEEKLEFVIENLLDNAIKYTPRGGMVKISLSLKDKNIEFAIQDNGIGIPKEQQESVFGKFFRASNAIRIETEGNGTGLFIAKNIIEAHQGKIWFESVKNQGTTFYFNLPVNNN